MKSASAFKTAVLAFSLLAILGSPAFAQANAELFGGVRPMATTLSIPPVFESGETGAAGDPGSLILRQPGWTAAVTQTAVEIALGSSGGYRMKWDGAERSAEIQGIDRQPGVANYLMGLDKSKWRIGVPQFGKAASRRIYPGVDVVYYPGDDRMEYDLELAPHADRARIGMVFEGTRGMRITDAGDLVFQAGETEFTYRQPTAFQLRSGERVPVQVSYRFDSGARVGFRLGDYAESLPLVIDPVLSFSIIFPTDDTFFLNGIAVDKSGYVYLAGNDSGGNGNGWGPTVTKLDPVTQHPVYKTYFFSDSAYAVAADSSGDAYVTGSYGQQAFLMKLDGSGNLVFCEYFGDAAGSDTFGRAITLDSSGSIYFAGSTDAIDFPLKDAYQTTPTGNGFLVKLDNTGSTIFSTYLPAAPSSIATDPSGNIYLTGQTALANLSLANAIEGPGVVSQMSPAAFVIKFDRTASKLLYSGYLGTSAFSGGSAGTGIMADADGNAYVTGWTDHWDFPLQDPIDNTPSPWGNCFVVKLTSVGELAFSTLFGGAGGSSCYGLDFDSDGKIAIAGDTYDGSYLPTVDPIQSRVGDFQMGFVAVLNSDGSAAPFSSVLGATTGQNNLSGIAADQNGNLYVAGNTSGSDFPGAPTQSPGAGAFVSGIQLASSCTYQVSPQEFSFAASASDMYGTVSVTAPKGCVWNAVSGSPYLSVAFTGFSGGYYNGTGSATLTFSVSYSDFSDQTIDFLVAGQKVTVNLTGYGCTHEVLPTGTDTSLRGGPGFFQASVVNGCTYTPVASDSWITITSRGSVGDTGYVSFTAAASATPRQGTISIGNVAFTVTQDSSGVVNGITSPEPGTTLPSSSATFQWFLGAAFSPSGLSVGSAPGGRDIAYQAVGPPAQGVAVAGLPTDASMLYVRFWMSSVAGLQYADYVYQAAAPVPAIASLSPSFTIAGGGPFTLTVNGSSFGSDSVVQWNGADLATIYVSAGQITATTIAADLTSVGTASIMVYTAPPGGGTSNAATFTLIAQSTGLQFYPVTPCRVLDTRAFAGFAAPFGAPSLAGGSSRSFPLPSSTSCSIPASAVAYSLNVTAVPSTGYLGWITVWATGQAEPVVSTLNAWSGLITANAAIVPAGTGGAISVYASDPTDVFVDINGYFAPPQSTGLDLYTLTPCRVADTRTFAGFPAPFGPPSLAGNSTRAFPVLSSTCDVPSTATAYALNVTAVPDTNYLGWLTVWRTEDPQPVVSTLNAWTGLITANAAIVPVGAGGSISFYASDATDLFFDINGYFGPPRASGLKFYPVTPCRVADTRSFAGMSGAFGPPSMAGNSARSFPVPSSACGIPTTAVAYSLNMTAAPSGSYLGWLTTWPSGTVEPVVSTLNAWDGLVRANAAIVPAGADGAISVYVSDPADVFFDINGYFAP
jgi:hypothetical protein